MNKQTFRETARAWMGDARIAAHLETMLEPLLAQLKEDGLRAPTRVARIAMLDETRCQHERGALLVDPLLGNCQLQLEFQVDWDTGPMLVFGAFALAPGADPLPLVPGPLGVASATDDDPLLVSVLVGQDHLNWHILPAAEAAGYLAKWLEEQAAGLPGKLAELRAGLTEAMSP